MQSTPSEHSHSQPSVVEYVAQIIAAYVSNNTVAVADLARLIGDVHGSMTGVGNAPAIEALVPAVDPKKSVKHDHIICLEDGRRFKALKRHLGTEHGMTPDQYRQKWNLPHDYPMTAAEYSDARSKMAKHAGLGRKATPKPAKKRATR